MLVPQVLLRMMRPSAISSDAQELESVGGGVCRGRRSRRPLRLVAETLLEEDDGAGPSISSDQLIRAVHRKRRPRLDRAWIATINPGRWIFNQRRDQRASWTIT